METHNVKNTTPGIRLILYIASFLVMSVGISLYFLSNKTNLYFAWTIYPPLSAAFLGSGYLASFILEFLSARERIWTRARPAIPGVLAFTALTLVVTLLHLDQFHFDSPRFITKAGTWVWVGIYAGVPIAMTILWVYQSRRSGIDSPRIAPLPSGMRWVLSVQGVVLFLFGCAMLLFPNKMISFWPWRLYTLTSQAIGAWGIGIGVIALHATLENDWWRLFPLMSGYAVYGALQLISLVRYPGAVRWTQPSAFIYTLLMISVFLTGLFGTWKSGHVNRDHASK